MYAKLKAPSFSENVNSQDSGGSLMAMFEAPGVGFEPTRPREATGFKVII